MFIAKKHISRRTLLRGAGVTLALPLLDAMVPAATALAQTPANPKSRFFGAFVCHGMAPGYWVPEAEGALPAALPPSTGARWSPIATRPLFSAVCIRLRPNRHRAAPAPTTGLRRRFSAPTSRRRRPEPTCMPG